jgi:hypothetical protein
VHSTGRESVDDNGAASANDDLANATAGAIVQISSAAAPMIISPEFAAEFAALTSRSRFSNSQRY